MSFDTTLLSEETRNALDAARTALANDPINKTIALVAAASGGKQVGLSFNVTLGEPDEASTDDTNDTPAASTAKVNTKANTKANTGDYGPPASEVRAKAEAAGFDLGDRSLRSKADKLAAMAEIDAFIANSDEDSDDESVDEDSDDESVDEVVDDESVDEVVDDLLKDID